MIALRLVLVITLAPTVAFAQQLPPVTIPAKPGPTVIVHDNKGAETKGKLLSLDMREAVLMIDGQERRFALTDVRRIEKRGDSLKNGAIIGAAVGLVSGLLVAGIGAGIGAAGCTLYGDTPGCEDFKEDFNAFGLAATTAAVWGAIGAGIDALIVGRTTLYQAPTGTAVLELRPNSIALRVRW